MKLFKFILNAVVYYVILRLLIWLILLFTPDISELINYDYSSNLTWYFVWFFTPIIVSFIIVKKLKLNAVQQIGMILLPLLIVANFVSGNYNKEYWGYSFKRPPVFQELTKASEIVSIYHVAKPVNEEHFKKIPGVLLMEDLLNHKSLYYNNLNRAVLYLSEINDSFKETNYWIEISINSASEQLNKESSKIFDLITASNLLIKPDKGYENRLGGRIITFITNKGSKYHQLSLTSGEIANDHYANYEILFENTDSELELIKSQCYFTDFAGIEGFEYSNLAGFIEFVLLVFVSLLVALFNGIKIVFTRWKT